MNDDMINHLKTLKGDEVFKDVIRSIRKSQSNIKQIIELAEQAEKVLNRMHTATHELRELLDADKVSGATECALANASGVEEYSELMQRINFIAMREGF